jgi:hypothetical protein
MTPLRLIVAGSLVALCASSFAQTTPSRDDRMAQALQNYRSSPAATARATPNTGMAPMSPRHAMQHRNGVEHRHGKMHHGKAGHGKMHQGMKHHGKMHAPGSSVAPVGKKSASDMTKG